MTAANRAVIRQLVLQANDPGMDITGPGGLLKQITKVVLESARDEEMSDHRGYDAHAIEGQERRQLPQRRRCQDHGHRRCRRGPHRGARDREGRFEPKLGKRRQRRLGDLDAMVLSLYAKALITGSDLRTSGRGTARRVSKDTVSRITDGVLEEMQAWWARPLGNVNAAVFLYAIGVKVRIGQVRHRPFYPAISVALDGRKDVLGM